MILPCIFYMVETQAIDLQACFKNLGDDPTKVEAQKMATAITTLQGLWQDLLNDPTLAKDKSFWSQLATAVGAIDREYSYIQSTGVIPAQDLASMFDTFQLNVLSLKDDPSATETLDQLCADAQSGQPAGLEQLLTDLTQEPGVLKILIKDSGTASQDFQTYANQH